MKPYKYNIVKDNYYEFTTLAGTHYACYFLSYSLYFNEYKEISENIFAFNIEVLAKGNNIFIDPRIGYTVVQIIINFLSELTNAAIYVCDTSDSRELMRKKKFDQWFRQYDDGAIIKVDGHIEIENFNIYNAILIHKDNPLKNRFIEAFNELNDQSEK